VYFVIQCFPLADKHRVSLGCYEDGGATDWLGEDHDYLCGLWSCW